MPKDDWQRGRRFAADGYERQKADDAARGRRGDAWIKAHDGAESPKKGKKRRKRKGRP